MKLYLQSEKVKELILASRWQEACELLENLCQKSPSPWALNDLALVLARLGKRESALELIERALKEEDDVRIKINHFYLSELLKLNLSRGENAGERVKELKVGDTSLKPKLSIIMRTYNRSDLISEAIESVLAQKFSDWELVVVNDGGERSVEKVLENLWDKRLVYAYAEHSGPAGAFNVGLRLARGELIGFLDDDDIVYPEHFSRLVKYLDEHPTCPAVYSDINLVWLDAKGNIVKKKFHQAGQWQEKKLWSSFFLMNLLSLVIRRTCLDKVVGFVEGFKNAVDWQFALELARHFSPHYLLGAGGELRYWENRWQVGKKSALERNHQRNLILYFYGISPFYSFGFLKKQKPELVKALAYLFNTAPNLLCGLELRKLHSEPAYALFYQLGKELEKEGKPKQAKTCYKSALKLAPYEIKIWSKLIKTL